MSIFPLSDTMKSLVAENKELFAIMHCDPGVIKEELDLREKIIVMLAEQLSGWHNDYCAVHPCDEKTPEQMIQLTLNRIKKEQS